MRLDVVDCEVVFAFYREEVLQHAPCLTQSTKPLFESLGSKSGLAVDSGEKIESEWRETVKDPDWFDVWYSRLLIENAIVPVEAIRDAALEKALEGLGWRKGSRDKWYVRAALAVVRRGGADRIALVTEDLDFYDPAEKSRGAERRAVVLDRSSGAVAKTLRKHAIDVVCVAKHPV